MLNGYTLVLDMDGTVVPTPSKSKGHFAPLISTHSNPLIEKLAISYPFKTGCPCAYHSLRDFLRHGANLAVVTTAGRRSWWQLYGNLKDVLFSPGVPPSGRLLLCGFSGAAIFASRVSFDLNAPSATAVDTTDEAARMALPTQSAAYVQGMEEITAYRLHALPSGGETSFSSSVGFVILTLATAAVRFFICIACLDDVTRRLEKESVCWHSPAPTKYTPVEGSIIAGLSGKYHGAYGPLAQELSDRLEQSLTSEGKTSEHLNNELVFIDNPGFTAMNNTTEECRLVVQKFASYFAVSANLALEKFRAKWTSTNKNASGVTAKALRGVLANFMAERLSREQLEEKGMYIKATCDAFVELTNVPKDGTANDPLVQVSLLGIPMTHFDKVFSPEVLNSKLPSGMTVAETLKAPPIAADIRSQPNSVAITRSNVNKLLQLKWMTSRTGEPCLVHENPGDCAANPSFCASIDLRRALALGDMPLSLDAALRDFPPMSFVSVASGAEEQRILSKATETRNEGAILNLQEKELIHVGHEEIGTGVFLRFLLDSLENSETLEKDKLLFDYKTVVEAAAATRKLIGKVM